MVPDSGRQTLHNSFAHVLPVLALILASRAHLRSVLAWRRFELGRRPFIQGDFCHDDVWRRAGRQKGGLSDLLGKQFGGGDQGATCPFCGDLSARECFAQAVGDEFQRGYQLFSVGGSTAGPYPRTPSAPSGPLEAGTGLVHRMPGCRQLHRKGRACRCCRRHQVVSKVHPPDSHFLFRMLLCPAH